MHILLEILRGLVMIVFGVILLPLAIIISTCKFIYYGYKGIAKENDMF